MTTIRTPIIAHRDFQRSPSGQIAILPVDISKLFTENDLIGVMTYQAKPW